MSRSVRRNSTARQTAAAISCSNYPRHEVSNCAILDQIGGRFSEYPESGMFPMCAHCTAYSYMIMDAALHHGFKCEDRKTNNTKYLAVHAKVSCIKPMHRIDKVNFEMDGRLGYSTQHRVVYQGQHVFMNLVRTFELRD